MQSFILALAMGLFNWCGKMQLGYNLGYVFFEAFTASFLAGIIVGKPIEGLIIGGTIQMIYIGIIAPGGNMPTDSTVAGCVVAPIALLTGIEPTVAVTLAVPVGLLGVFLINLRKTIMIRFVYLAEQYAEEANVKGVQRCAVLYPAILNFFVAFLPVFLAVLFGSSVVEAILRYIPEVVMHGLEVAGGMLPALGFAVLMHMIGKAKYIPFMLLGFFIMQMTGWSSLILAIMGGCIAVIIVVLKKELKMEEV